MFAEQFRKLNLMVGGHVIQSRGKNMSAVLVLDYLLSCATWICFYLMLYSI